MQFSKLLGNAEQAPKSAPNERGSRKNLIVKPSFFVRLLLLSCANRIYSQTYTSRRISFSKAERDVVITAHRIGTESERQDDGRAACRGQRAETGRGGGLHRRGTRPGPGLGQARRRGPGGPARQPALKRGRGAQDRRNAHQVERGGYHRDRLGGG